MQISKVLVVDGDRVARNALVTGLRFVGLEAYGAENAAAAQSWLSNGRADVLILSDELADGTPSDVVRKSAECPKGRASILILTRGGATAASLPNYPIDETLRRPIALSQVVERVEAMIHERAPCTGAALKFGALSLDVANARASFCNLHVELGRTEVRLLAFFMRAPERVFSRAELLRRLWPSNVRVEERTVDVHIRRLRLQLAKVGCNGYFQTVRAAGYRFSSF